MKKVLVGHLFLLLAFPIGAFAGVLSGEDVRAQVLNAISITNGTPWQSRMGLSPNRKPCQVSIGYQNYPYRSLSVSVIEYTSPQGNDGDYHYFQVVSADKVWSEIDNSTPKYLVVRNQVPQEIEISGRNNSRIVSVSDKNGKAQCFINL